jgi:hypothetical protein
VLDSTPGPSFVFGTHSGSGTVEPLLSVDAAGNLTVEGAVKAKGTAGKVQAIGGTASDGTVLPLPNDVDQAAVDSGGIELFTALSPHLPQPGSGPAAGSLFVPAECRIDNDRRVHSWGYWFSPGSAGTTVATISADFLVVAAVSGGP